MNTCETCRHWGGPGETSNVQRNCTRYPPTAFPIPASQGLQLSCFFPVTTKSNLCGEYFRKMEATQ